MTYSDEQLRRVMSNAKRKTPLSGWRPSSVTGDVGKAVAALGRRVCSGVAEPPAEEPAWKRRWLKLRPEAVVGTRVAKLPASAQRNLPAVRAWQGKPPGLLLYGPTRTGKTRSAWLRLFDACKLNCFCQAYEGGAFSRTLGKNYRSETGEAFVENVKNVQLLLLDDLDKMRATAAVVNDVFSILDHRCQHCKPTIVTMNSTPAELARYMGGTHGEALCGRLNDPDVFQTLRYERDDR